MQIEPAFRPELAKLSEQSFELSADVVYLVDDQLRLRGYNDAWRDFALNNFGADVLTRYPLGRSILDAMSSEPRAFYASAYRSSLDNHVRFDKRFECSSANVYRQLHQSAYPIVGARGLVITNHIVEERPMDRLSQVPAPLYLTSEGLILQCSHCRRVQAHGIANRWDWVPQWVDQPHPSTSHVLCPTCADFYYNDSMI